MKNETVIINYVLKTNFGDFIGGGFPYPTKLKIERDPNYAATWYTVERASNVAESINNRYRTENNETRVAVVRREVHTSYKLIGEFPKE